MTVCTNVIIRGATEEDAEGLVDFVVKNIIKTAPLERTLRFDEDDARDYWERIVRIALPENVSLVAIDKSTNEIVGCQITSVWDRNPSKNPTLKQASTPKANLKCMYSPYTFPKSQFSLIVVPARSSLLGTVPQECQQSLSLRTVIDPRGLPKEQNRPKTNQRRCPRTPLGGVVGVATSLANQRNLARFPMISLAELSYKEFFTARGLPFGEALVDGATKAVLTCNDTVFRGLSHPKTVALNPYPKAKL
uniref:N-acetyltransferase domain-containing protein n=1 Tax=Steinernema glaseri TaxID=37863 RepID=A0A1I7Y5K8_9BILA